MHLSPLPVSIALPIVERPGEFDLYTTAMHPVAQSQATPTSPHPTSQVPALWVTTPLSSIFVVDSTLCHCLQHLNLIPSGVGEFEPIVSFVSHVVDPVATNALVVAFVVSTTIPNPILVPFGEPVLPSPSDL